MNFFALLLYSLHYFRYFHCCWFGYILISTIFILSLFLSWIYCFSYTQFFVNLAILFCCFLLFEHTRKETTVRWLAILYIVCLRREERTHFIVDRIKFSNDFWFKQKKYSTSLWIINFYWKSSHSVRSIKRFCWSKQRNFSTGFSFPEINEKSNRRKSIQSKSIHNFIQTKTIHVVAP